MDELRYKVAVLEEEMQRMSINLEAIEAYRVKDAEYGERVKDLDAATAQRDAVSMRGKLTKCQEQRGAGAKEQR